MTIAAVHLPVQADWSRRRKRLGRRYRQLAAGVGEGADFLHVARRDLQRAAWNCQIKIGCS